MWPKLLGVLGVLTVAGSTLLVPSQAHSCDQYVQRAVSYSSYAAPAVSYQRAVTYQAYVAPQQYYAPQSFSLGYDTGEKLQQQLDQLRIENKLRDTQLEVLKLQQQLLQQPQPQFQQQPTPVQVQPPAGPQYAPAPVPQPPAAPAYPPPQQQYQQPPPSHGYGPPQQPGYPPQQPEQQQPQMQKLSKLSILQNKCSRCHEAGVAGNRGAGFTLTHQGRPVQLTADQQKVLFERVAVRRDMPPGTKLNNEELWSLVMGS